MTEIETDAATSANVFRIHQLPLFICWVHLFVQSVVSVLFNS